MANFEYFDNSAGIVDRIDNPIIPLPNPVSLLGREFFASMRPRFLTQRTDSLNDPAQVSFGNPAQLIGRRFPDKEPIFFHRA
jgi:hypothetical protein